MHRLHCLLIAALLLLSPLTALAGDHQWSGNGPFATGLGNRAITALALSSDGKQVYAGTGSGTVHRYAYTAPTATSGAATGISSSGATLNGSVNAHNADATVSFEYGLTTAYGTSVGGTPGTVSGASDTAVSTSLSGLTAGTTYHFRVVATNSSGTSYGSDLSFTVGKLNQTIGAVSFVPNSLVANGTTTASATASSGLTVTFTSTTPTVCTVSGSTVTGVTVGTCTIAGNQAGSGAYYAAAQVTQSLSVGQGTASVTLGSLNQYYDGVPQIVTGTTVPTGLTVDFTYDGSATAPAAVGSYAVVGTINNANYQGSASGTLVINKSTATVTLGGLTQTYDGSAKAATTTTNPTGLTVGFTYDGSFTVPTAVGSYAVVGTINDVNYQGSASGTLVINKSTATVTLGNLTQTYDGSAKAATATTTPTGLTVDFTYDGSSTVPTAVGNYAVVGTINDANYQGSASGTLVVGSATASVILGNLTQTYDGSAKAVTATTTPTGLTVGFTYDGSVTVPTVVGSYAVVGTINDANYQGLASGTLVISNATASVSLGNLTQTYDGSAKAATATTTPTGLTVGFTYDGSATAPSTVGSYAVVGTINDANYQGSTSGTLVISNATASVTLGNLSQAYDGSAKAATATTTPTGLTVDFTYDGSATAPTAVGSYAVVGTINDANYQGSTSGTLVISNATASVTLGNLTQTYDGSAKAATATTTPTGLTVGFTYDGSATAPTAVGSYAVVGTINDANSNYQGTATGTLVIADVLVYHVTPSSGTGGSIIPSTVQTVIDGGSTSFTLNVETGYQIDSVSGCGGSLTGNTYTTGIINSNCTVIASFVLIPDTTPPVLTLSTLPDGAVTRSADLNLAGRVSDETAMGRLTINGIPVVIHADNSFSQLMTLVEGSNTLTTIATDAKGNSVTDIRSITLDSTAPSLTIMTPVDNGQTGTAILTVSGAIEAGALCDLVLNGESPLVATVSDTNYSLDITLNEGLNSIDVTGSDNLGNSTTLHRTITLDSEAPRVQITAPNADSTVNDSTLILEGSASDATSAVSISLNIDGQIFIPPLDSNGHFSLNLALTEERTYVVILTARDALGNQSSVTRNFIYKRPYLWGDTNGDELVDVDDALLTLQIAVGIEPLQPKNLLRGDVAPLINGRPQPDGKLTAGDALIILRRAVGLVNW